MALTEPVAAAVTEIGHGVPEVAWQVREDGAGGAVLVGHGVALGGVWEQAETWIGFRIPFNYPYADIYPHFVRGDLRRRDSGPLGEAMSTTTFEGMPAVQLSRRSNHRVPGIETALLKLLKVLTWLRERP
jgi:hypothetical protein